LDSWYLIFNSQLLNSQLDGVTIFQKSINKQKRNNPTTIIFEDNNSVWISRQSAAFNYSMNR
jgi:hypothetical protein